MSDLEDELADARAAVAEDAADFLPDVMTVYTPSSTETPDGAGGFTVAEGTPAQTAHCRYRAIKVSERMSGGQAVAISTHVIQCPFGAAIQANSRGTIAARGDVGELSFQVDGSLTSSEDLLLSFGATLQGS